MDDIIFAESLAESTLEEPGLGPGPDASLDLSLAYFGGFLH